MNPPNHTFIKAVEESRVLTQEQKQLFLEDVDSLSIEYKNNVHDLLTSFDEHSKERENLLRTKLEHSYKQFVEQLDHEGVEESKKEELLAKAKKQINSFFPQAPHA